MGAGYVGWLLLAALAIIWAAFLLPSWRGSPDRSVKDFERNMDRLAETDGQGRWIVTPRKGMAFIGTRARAKERARVRRRRVFAVFLETIALTFLIGLVPPLRAMWWATALLLGLLGVYVWLLVTMRAREVAPFRTPEIATAARPRPARHRYAADAPGLTARASFDGLAALGGDELANIVVKPASHVGVAGI